MKLRPVPPLRLLPEFNFQHGGGRSYSAPTLGRGMRVLLKSGNSRRSKYNQDMRNESRSHYSPDMRGESRNHYPPDMRRGVSNYYPPEDEYSEDMEEMEMRRRRGRSGRFVRGESRARMGYEAQNRMEPMEDCEWPEMCGESSGYTESRGYAGEYHHPEMTEGGSRPMGFRPGVATPFQEFGEKGKQMYQDARKVLDDPPPTWKNYLERGDFAGILAMESKELANALASKKSPDAVKKEISHVLAALMGIGK